MKNSECQSILQQAIQWAEQNADPETFVTYRTVGQQMTTDEDIPMTNGGLWIYWDLVTSEDDAKT